MRTKYTLWKASNGWLLVPEGNSDSAISASDVKESVVFKSLKEFAEYKPKRERKRRVTKPTKEPEHANIN
jgi:hypothetical protein